MQRGHVQASARRTDLSRALVFGGAFNPPTRAHIELAKFAMNETGFDKVIFVPTKQTYIADEQRKEYVFSDEERLKMLDADAADHPWMEVSRFEIESETQPRTYKTLCHYRDRGDTCSLLFGSDKLPELETVWCYVEEIAQEFGIVCMKRSDDDPKALIDQDPYLRTLKPYIRLVDTPASTRFVSSTKIRVSLAEMNREFQKLSNDTPPELHDILLEVIGGKGLSA